MSFGQLWMKYDKFMQIMPAFGESYQAEMLI